MLARSWYDTIHLNRSEKPLTSSQGKNTGVKAVFGGAQKKPLMTKVSMRHLNEIVRERNQYSRDAMEAWQDFINLKCRMDTELTKVSKRNNFLVEELESWKQQFLKFQAFAEQLTKETNELKIKIEGHKRENRRLTALIEQQKDDNARLTVRLSGTEKQRDDALEALVLQQEIAEELERERKRNKKDLSALQHTNTTLLRQRDEAQRVVLHLRALIDGQAHHMEHIVKSLNESPDGAILNDAEESDATEGAVVESPKEQAEFDTSKAVAGPIGSVSSSRASTRQSSRADGEDSSQAAESRLLSYAARKRLSVLSMTDVADRHLRDKTDAIAYIIRNISEQCAAAVEGLDLARRADTSSTVSGDDDRSESGKKRGKRPVKKLSGESVDGESNDYQTNASESEFGDAPSEASGYLRPKRVSHVPSTPDLVHDRSSTSMSLGSESVAHTPQRQSMSSQYSRSNREEVPAMPTRIVDSDEVGDTSIEEVEEPVTKFDAQPVQSQPSQAAA
jgi:hypothetical protein